jgi:hypothetical protein
MARRRSLQVIYQHPRHLLVEVSCFVFVCFRFFVIVVGFGSGSIGSRTKKNATKNMILGEAPQTYSGSGVQNSGVVVVMLRY